MVQTRAEAATLVVKLQRTAVTQGLMMYGIAAMAAMSFMTALIVLIAVAAPPAWRVPVLFLVTAALLGTAIYAVLSAGRKVARDAKLIADFSRGIKLDLAMINLALQDAEPDDEEKLEKRERTKTAVREAAAEKAATPSTAEGGVAPSMDGPSMGAAAAAMHAASPAGSDPDATAPAATQSVPGSSSRFESIGSTTGDGDGRARSVGSGAYATTGSADHLTAAATEREMPEPPLTTPEAMTIPQEPPERVRHGRS